MDRQHRLRALLKGTGCTVCGGRLATDEIRVLAEREDLVFLELPCSACGARTLGMVTGPVDGDERLDIIGYGEFGPADEARFADAPPLHADDLLAMHGFLSGYGGDLRSLLETPGPGRPAGGGDAAPGPSR